MEETIISCESSIEDIYVQLFEMDDDEVDAFEDLVYRIVEAIARYRLMEASGEGH